MSVLCAKVYWDIILFAAHLAQGVTYTVFGADSETYPARIPATITIPSGRPGNISINLDGNSSTGYIAYNYFIANPVLAVAVFFYITALAHFVRAINAREQIPCCRSKKVSDTKINTIDYTTNLRNMDRIFRWMEYTITSTIMIGVILLESGVTDFYALVGLGTANGAMILFGWAGDLVDPNLENAFMFKLRTFLFGALVGLAPWICIYIQAFAMIEQTPPEVVIAIIGTLFFLFFCFAFAELYYIFTFRWERMMTKDRKKNITVLGCMNYTLNPENINKSRERVEFTYQILSAVAKTLLGALTAAAMLTI